MPVSTVIKGLLARSLLLNKIKVHKTVFSCREFSPSKHVTEKYRATLALSSVTSLLFSMTSQMVPHSYSGSLSLRHPTVRAHSWPLNRGSPGTLGSPTLLRLRFPQSLVRLVASAFTVLQTCVAVPTFSKLWGSNLFSNIVLSPE